MRDSGSDGRTEVVVDILVGAGMYPLHALEVAAEIEAEYARTSTVEAAVRIGKAQADPKVWQTVRTEVRARLRPVILQYAQVKALSARQVSARRREAEAIAETTIDEQLSKLLPPPARATRKRADGRPSEGSWRQFEAHVVEILCGNGVATTGGGRKEPAAVILEIYLGHSADPRNRTRRALRRIATLERMARVISQRGILTKRP